MGKKATSSVGIAFDNFAVHAIRLSAKDTGTAIEYAFEGAEKIPGPFNDRDSLVAALKKVREQLHTSSANRVTTCIGGKQVHVSQISFKRLPPAEMKNALRFELRKRLHFEIAGSSLDYQILNPTANRQEMSEIIVSVVSNTLMAPHLGALSRAGIKPDCVDVLPTAIGNIYWASLPYGEKPVGVHVVVHLGPDATTLVFTGGQETPFFTRTIYLSLADLFESDREEGAAQRKLQLLREEIVRSLSYVEKTGKISQFEDITLSGDYIDKPELTELFTMLGIPVAHSGLSQKVGAPATVGNGPFDIALVCAMRS